MSATLDPTTIGTARRWSMLGASTLGQAASAIAAHGPAFLIPALREHEGLTLAQAGVVAAAPTLGVMLTLVAWGVLTDRRGERRVLIAGLALTAGFSLVAVLVHGLVLLTVALFLAGAAAASANAASGRVVVGWFPPHRRGLAMGIRQMAQPAGVAMAAVSMAVIADAHGIGAALLVPTVAAAVAAEVVAVVVVDPPRPAAAEGGAPSPYRADSYLARIHGVSVLLVVPQFVVWTFSLVWLVEERGWSPAAAGTLVAVAQVVAAFGRIAAGQLSDLVGSRMLPLRWVAVSASATMALLALAAGLDVGVAVPLLVVATVLTVADNGLAFTAVAERAGPHWSGRALGVQNTAQFLTSALVPPLGGLLVTHAGYAATFAVAAVLPAVAVALVPVREERVLS
ncbi:MFS transporter [Nocardioides plantarum]|uniref:MFS transporter n=1 Tax=Nocardioides plantarum TaxID=29299 RepID=A0ABV5K5C0_9ACTN|nr:MFS transporter [Nocardioides plantarum]